MHTIADVSWSWGSPRQTGRWEVLPLTRDVSAAVPWTWVAAGLLGASSLARLTLGGAVTDRSAADPALVAHDVTALAVVVPLLVAASIVARRGSVRALIAWLGALVHVAIGHGLRLVETTTVTPVLATDVAVVGLCAGAAGFLLAALDPPEFRRQFRDVWPVRTTAAFLIGLSGVLALLWLQFVMPVAPALRDLDAARALVSPWSLGVVPIMVGCAWGLWRERPLGHLLAGVWLVSAVPLFARLLVATGLAFRAGQPADVLEFTAYGVGLFDSGALLLLYLAALPAAAIGPAVRGARRHPLTTAAAARRRPARSSRPESAGSLSA